MLNAVLRRSGGSLIVTIPAVYAEQNHLTAGSQVGLDISGATLTMRVRKVRPKLAELLAATPKDLPLVPGWDELAPVGQEL